jgi:GNAT superfamily N-acetyltransferase
MVIVREARPQDARGIARVHIDSWRTTYRGVVPADYLDRLSVDDRARRWRQNLAQPGDKQCVFVAEDDRGEIVGFASGGPERSGDPVYAGELYAIYLLQERQRQGIGRRLTRAVAERLSQYGMGSMLLWVLAANPSRRFYEAIGGQQLRTETIAIGGVTLDEVAYGWTDTTALVRSLADPA